jgi:hypothetical protein
MLKIKFQSVAEKKREKTLFKLKIPLDILMKIDINRQNLVKNRSFTHPFQLKFIKFQKKTKNIYET